MQKPALSDTFALFPRVFCAHRAVHKCTAISWNELGNQLGITTGNVLRKSIRGSAVVLRSPLGRRGEGNRRHHRVTVRAQGSPGAWNAVCHPCQPRLLGKESLN